MNFFVARDCNYRDEKFCNVSKADSIARHYILLSKLRSSWRFLKFSEALHVYSNRNFYVRNHVSQKAKGEISNWDAIANRETAMNIQVQANNTLTADTDDQKFNCDNADGQSQTGIRKTSRENKGYEKRLETLCMHHRSNLYLHKLPFIVDLTDIKSWIVFKFCKWTNDFCYFNYAKFPLTFRRKASSEPCESVLAWLTSLIDFSALYFLDRVFSLYWSYCGAMEHQKYAKFQAERLKARLCQFLRFRLVEKIATLSHTCLLLQTR